MVLVFQQGVWLRLSLSAILSVFDLILLRAPLLEAVWLGCRRHILPPLGAVQTTVNL